MELPKKLEAPEYCTWSKESPEAKINELIDYLESQKEGESYDKRDHAHCWENDKPACGGGLHSECCLCRKKAPKEKPKVCKHGKAYICAECNDKFSPVKEEPKQLDVEGLLESFLKRSFIKYLQSQQEIVKNIAFGVSPDQRGRKWIELEDLTKLYQAQIKELEG